MLLYLPTHNRIDWVDRDTNYAVVDVTAEVAARWLAVIDRTKALGEELGAADLELCYGDWAPAVYTDWDMEYLSDEEHDTLEDGEPLATMTQPPATLAPAALAYCALTVDSQGLWWSFALGEGAAPESTQYVSRALLQELASTIFDCKPERWRSASPGRDGTSSRSSRVAAIPASRISAISARRSH